MDMVSLIMMGIFLILSFGIIFIILVAITSAIAAGIYCLVKFFNVTKLKKYSFLFMEIPLVALLVNRVVRMLTTTEVHNPGVFLFDETVPYYPDSFQFIFDVEIILSTVILIISMVILFLRQHKKEKHQ